MKTKFLLLPFLLAPALAACTDGGQEGGTTSVFQHLSINNNGDVTAHAHDGSSARIDSAGDLEIRGKRVDVTQAQRELLKSYHADALAVRGDAIATGKAGARTGLHAVGAVVSGLASGKPDSIDAKVDASADEVRTKVRALCQDLARLYSDQGKLVVALPSFGPYATIESHEVSDCEAD